VANVDPRRGGRRLHCIRGSIGGFADLLGGIGPVRQSCETAGALRIIELVPIGSVVERQVAREFERTHFALVSHVDGRHKTQAEKGEHRRRQDCTDDPAEIRQHFPFNVLRPAFYPAPAGMRLGVAGCHHAIRRLTAAQ
jgi:hypothetical protein